jgi:murein DD-endopeptidase MepM/ murein hydrolase activator NlpD
LRTRRPEANSPGTVETDRNRPETGEPQPETAENPPPPGDRASDPAPAVASAPETSIQSGTPEGAPAAPELADGAAAAIDGAPADVAGPDSSGGEVASEAPDPILAPPPEPIAPARPDRRPLALPILAGSLFALTTLSVARPPPPAEVTAAPVQSAAPSLSSATLAVDPPATAEVADAGPPFSPKWRVSALKDDATMVVTEVEVGKRTLVAALQHAQVSKAEAARVAKAFEEAHKERVRARDALTVARVKDSGHVVAVEIASSPSDVWQAREEGDKLAFQKLELSVERRALKLALVVKDDLGQAARDAGLGDEFLHALEDALDGHVDLAEVKRGARAKVVATEERIERTFVHYPRIDAAEITTRGGKAVRVYSFEREGKEGEGKRRERGAATYDAKGQRPYRGNWRSPVPFARVTSRFNPHRLHPVLKVVMPHNGVDFGAGTGTPVYATAPGTVKSVGDGGPCGNMVQIDHAGGLTTAYCHLSRFAAGIHAGQHVEARQLVGYVGQTGRVTGPHLHFAVKRGETFIDPLAMKLDGVRTLPARDRAAFQKQREARDAELDAISFTGGAVEVDGGGDDEVFSDVVEDDGGAKP